MIQRLLVLLIALLAIASPAEADEFKPAYLQLRQTGAETYDVVWKIPALDESRALGIEPRFPEGTRELTRHRSGFAGASVSTHWTASIPGGLEGKSIRFDRLPASGIDVLIRLELADGSSQVERLLPGRTDVAFRPEPGAFEVAWTYLVLGVEHILMGVDHLLFVAALVLLVNGGSRLFWTITSFTVAHSITLALATLGLVNVPGPPVEAAIALSIVFVAVEIVRRQTGQPSLASEQPWLVGFCFGLLHGLGFAGALAEIGLPRDSIPLALLSFNVGVEIGQLLFVGGLLILSAVIFSLIRSANPRRAIVIPAYVIGSVASFWLIERLVILSGA